MTKFQLIYGSTVIAGVILSLMLSSRFRTGLHQMFDSETTKSSWRKIITATILWIPMQMHWLKGAFSPLIDGSVDFGRAFYVIILSACMLFIFQDEQNENTRSWSLTKKSLQYLANTYLIFIVVLIPLSLGMGFTKVAFTHKIWQLPIIFIEIFFATAFVEELFFRGILQQELCNLMPTRFAWVVASLLFGLMHINNVGGGHEFPNWPYVILATIAGLGYGYVYQKTHSLLAAILLHTAVDFTWLVFLHG